MFKLFRDSLFKPKNIINYRAKKFGFTFLYMLILSIIMGISTCASSFSYKEIGYTEKMNFEKKFNETNAKINDGIFSSDSSFMLSLSKINIAFIKNDESLSDITQSANIVVYGDGVYLLIAMTPKAELYKISTITEISPNLNNIDLSNLSDDSVFFSEVNKLILYYRNYVISGMFFIGLIQGYIFMLGYALITYFFMLVFFRAGDFMKRGQLFKMLIYASTSVILMESLIILFNVNSVYSWLLIFISFIPLYLLEREIIGRIRTKIFGSSVINNQGIMDKVNEFLKEKQEQTDENKDSLDDVKYDDEEENDDDNEYYD